MRYKMKRKRPEIAGVATTDGAGAAAREARGPRLADEPYPAPLAAHIEALRGSAEALVANGADAIPEIYANVEPLLELDAGALYVAQDDGLGLALAWSSGLAEAVLSRLALAPLVAELERAGRRTLVLESLAHNSDPRAAPFRGLDLASAAVGALVVDGRLLGAAVLASRSKEHYTLHERMLLDTVMCHFAAAYERRELAEHRHQAESRKREFLTVLAHELRNPLAPLRNALEIIRANDRTRSAVEHSAYAMIDRQLQHIGRLADDLLDANQVVLGNVELAKQRVLLETVVDRAAEQSRPWIEAARHTLAIELPREAVTLEADPKRLARVFSNLINNAARRMDRGGRIVLTAEVADDTASVFVRARGRTVAGGSMSSIFADAAAHSESSDGPSQGGFTAGMTLVKHLVEMHDGVVDARTTADGTAEFEVRLPLARRALPQRETAPEVVATEQATVPHRILIADDNADSAESMGMLLRLMGNDVRIASDGLDAVEQAEAFQPDIVLMDIGMPRLDGYEAARRIRNQEWSRETLLVAVTGWGPRDDSDEATAAGFDRHFTKPLDPAELRRLMNAVRAH
jgi:signal transduction histidine kinase/ActR/RegA family two-component response regulator